MLVDMSGSHVGYGPLSSLNVWTVVVSAGHGERFGADKSVASLGGKTVLEHSVAAAQTVGTVVVVTAADRCQAVEHLLEGFEKVAAVVAGGATRSASVRAGLAAVPTSAEILLVHDGARPLASPALFAAVVEAVRQGADAVVPGLTATDSLRWRQGGALDRQQVVIVQTPQGFSAQALRQAHKEQGETTDDASLVEAHGGQVEVVAGETGNIKVTHVEDLAILNHHLKLRNTDA